MHSKNLIRTYLQALKAISVGGLSAFIGLSCARGIDARIDGAYVLARHPNEGNKNKIEALLHDPDRDVRATALVVMQGIDRERAERIAAGALQDPDGLVRAAAVTIVASAADPEMKQRLAALAASDPVWQVRSRALDALASSDDPAARDTLAGALSDPVRHVRRAALRAGVARPGLLPVDRLDELVVSDPDWENRVEAARALGSSKDPEAFRGLDAAVADPNEFVRASAAGERKALEQAGVAR
jgi:HEAT repeat protein